MIQLKLGVCVEVSEVMSLYRGRYDGCKTRIVLFALQPPSGAHPDRPRKTADQTAVGVVRRNLCVAQQGPSSACYSFSASSIHLWEWKAQLESF